MTDNANKPPVINTEWGPVTEIARLQAALNIARDPALKARMIEQFGEARMRYQYPEAFVEGEDETQA